MCPAMMFVEGQHNVCLCSLGGLGEEEGDGWWGGWMNNLWQGNMWVSGRAFLAHKFCSMLKLQCHLKSIKMVINLWKCMSFRCQLMQSNLNSRVTEILPLGDNSGCDRILGLFWQN